MSNRNPSGKGNSVANVGLGGITGILGSNDISGVGSSPGVMIGVGEEVGGGVCIGVSGGVGVGVSGGVGVGVGMVELE